MSELLDGLRRRLDDGLRAAVGSAGECALVDFPRHQNVGDSAIWLGERAALARLGVDVRVACDSATFDADRMRSRLGQAPVLLHGGGNFGGLYRGSQEFRERILRVFADRSIVQLPQTINFVDEATFARTAELVRAHGDVTIMVRDHPSASLASQLGARVLLVPDGAFGLPRLDRPNPPTRDVLHLARSDFEAADRAAAREGVDWLELRSRRERLIAEWHKIELGVAAGRLGGGGGWLPVLAPRAYDRYVSWNVHRGTSLLASARVVIADRLHAHVLCTLMGIPHVLIDDRHSKISHFWDTWTREVAFARFAQNIEEARGIASQLAAM